MYQRSRSFFDFCPKSGSKVSDTTGLPDKFGIKVFIHLNNSEVLSDPKIAGQL